MRRSNKVILLTLLIFSAILNAEGVNIVINNVEENKGIELGENSRARGDGSISTGRNSIAIGKNSVATGNNETKESIENKLRENREKLDEISNKEKEVLRISKEVNDIKIRQRETIEAGIRVEQIKKAKENAKKEWDRLKLEYETEKTNSVEFFREYNSKLEDLNSRLSGLSKIQGLNISSEEGLNHAAGELKRIAENGTNLNLTLDFYKDYVSSYYRALGDLRENETISSKYTFDEFAKNKTNNINPISPYIYLSGLNHIHSGIYTYDEYMYLSVNDNLNSEYNNFNKNIFKNMSNAPEKNIVAINHNTDIVTKNQYDEVVSLVPKYKEAFREYFNKNNDIFLTPEVKEKIYEVFNLKADYKAKQYEIAYYQGEYEKTRNNTWLDKKKVALEELKNIEKEFKLKPYLANLRHDAYKKWKKENIDDIKEKNKITVDKLTSELEIALGINKNAILEKQKQLEAMKNKSDQAERNYNGINPSEKDLILAREYEQVSRELLQKGEILKIATERLKYLRDNLTLNDLTNVGENAIAIGTNTIASGNSSISFGKANISTKENAISIGNTNLVDGNNSVAIGSGNNILKGNSYIIGSQNTINGSNVYILGSNIDATDINDAIILGNGSKGANNSVSVGREDKLRKIVYVKEGEISSTSTEAVSGKQLYEVKNEIANKVNNDLSNVDNEILSNKLNKGSINSTTLEVTGNGKVLGESVTLEIKNGVVSKEKLSNTLKEEIEGKVNSSDLGSYAKIDASNINVTNYISKLSDGANLSTPKGKLVTDSMVKDILDKKVDKNDVYSKSEINSLVEGKLNSNDLADMMNNYVKKDGSNIDAKSKQAIISKLSEGANVLSPSGSVITDITLKELLDDKGYARNIDLTNKANKDLSNIEKTTIIEKVGNGNLENTNGSLVKDNVIKDYLISKYYNKFDIDKKLNSVNIETKGNILSRTLNILNGKDRLVGTKDLVIDIKDSSIDKSKLSESLINEIDNKANIDASNIDENKFVEKLSKGSNILEPKGKLVKDTDVREYLDKQNLDIKGIENRFKLVDAGISNAIAMAMIPQVSEKNYISFGAGSSYYNKQGAVALGISGSDKNKMVIYKLASSLDSKLNFSLGFGINVNLGKIEEKNNNDVELKDENNKLNEKIESLLEEISKLKKDMNNIRLLNKENKIVKSVVDKFEFDKYELSEENKEKIRKIFKDNKPEIIVLSGHADEIGTDEYNQKLSERRAEEVYKYIKSELELKSEIYYKGFGKKYPISKEDDSLNRRVEIEIH